MRIGAFDVGFSAGAGVDLPAPPSLPDVPDGPIVLEAEAIALGADGPPPEPLVIQYANPIYRTGMQTGAAPTGAARMSKYFAVAGAPGNYADATFDGAAGDYRGGGGAPAPSYDRSVYVGDTEVPTGALVAGGLVAVALAAFAAWRLGAFGR